MIFARQGVQISFCMPRKNLRSPFQNNPLGCFVHCVRFPSRLLLAKTRERRTNVRLSLVLVDPRGIEPLSENLLISPSPGAVRNFNFPSEAVYGQTSSLGSHFLRDRFNGEPSVHGLRLLDAQSEAAKLLRGTGG